MEMDPEGHPTEDPRAVEHQKAQEVNHADPEEHLGHPVAMSTSGTRAGGGSSGPAFGAGGIGASGWDGFSARDRRGCATGVEPSEFQKKDGTPVDCDQRVKR